jgi:arylsulfatase
MGHSFPHIPIVASPRFRGTSGFGLYGDAVAELDWSVGQVLQALRANGLDQNTLVMFTSDHGPWYQGSAGKLRGRKGETYEGGVRTPFIARFPGQIPAGTVCDGVASAMDILPTLARLSNAALPSKPLDGIDIWPLLNRQIDFLDREALLYFDDWQLQCARLGPWKLHVARYNSVVWTPQPAAGRMNLPLKNPELYNIQNDPEESYDLAADFPDVVAQIQARIQNLLPTFPDPVNSYWRDTRSLSVQATPADALPVLNP